MFHLREEEEFSSAKETKVGRCPNPVSGRSVLCTRTLKIDVHFIASQPDSEETPSSPSSITPPIDRTSPPANTQDPPVASISGSSTRTPSPERGEDEETGLNHGDSHTSRTQCYRGEKNGFPANNEGSHRYRRSSLNSLCWNLCSRSADMSLEWWWILEMVFLESFLGSEMCLSLSSLRRLISSLIGEIPQFVVQGFGSWDLLFVEVCKLNGKSSSSSIWFSVVSCASSECVPEQFKELQSLP
ncbi:hypothetical protein YC2023_084913 [Brassica napus]